MLRPATVQARFAVFLSTKNVFHKASRPRACCFLQLVDPLNRPSSRAIQWAVLSNAAQVGSGFDVSAAVYGTHTYTRFSPSELADALSAGDAPPALSAIDGSVGDSSTYPTPVERIATCVQARGGWDAERGQLRLPSCFRLLMGDVCGGSSTPSMVRKVSRGLSFVVCSH